MIESYIRDIVADDGAVLHDCYRLVKSGNIVDIYDMRLKSHWNTPGSYTKGHFTGLSQARFEEIKHGEGFLTRIGQVWIGSTGEWNVEYSPIEKPQSLPINRCLELLGYNLRKGKAEK